MSSHHLTGFSDYSVPTKDAHVIIWHSSSGSLKTVVAKDFDVGRSTLKDWIEKGKLVSDPSQETGQKVYKIIFYGTAASCKDCIDAERGKSSRSTVNLDQEEGGTQVSELSSQRSIYGRVLATSGLSKSTRSSNIINQHEILSLINSIRESQLTLIRNVDEIVRENNSINKKIDEILNKKDKDRKRLTYSEAAEVLQHCTTEVARMRMEKSFEEKLRRIDWEFVNVSAKQKEDILSELRWERRISKMVSSIGKIIYGSLLLTHILGRNGRRERTRRESERPNTFTVSQEDRLREVLRVFGDLFTTDKIWKAVVQHHINQKGRDVKKNQKRGIDDEETEGEESDNISPKKVCNLLEKSSLDVLDELGAITDNEKDMNQDENWSLDKDELDY